MALSKLSPILIKRHMAKKTIFLVEGVKGSYDVSWDKYSAFELKYDAAQYQEKADRIFKKLTEFYKKKRNSTKNTDDYFVYVEKLENYEAVEFYITELTYITR